MTLSLLVWTLDQFTFWIKSFAQSKHYVHS